MNSKRMIENMIEGHQQRMAQCDTEIELITDSVRAMRKGEGSLFDTLQEARDARETQQKLRQVSLQTIKELKNVLEAIENESLMPTKR